MPLPPWSLGDLPYQEINTIITPRGYRGVSPLFDPVGPESAIATRGG